MGLQTQSLSTAAPRQLHPVRQQGAYGVVRDRVGRVLIVRTESGRCYLPGGRLEPGESASAALTREIAEECGWAAQIGAPLGRHKQPIFGGKVSLDATYWQARLTACLDIAAEHVSLWLSPADALACLHRASDRAALRTALD